MSELPKGWAYAQLSDITRVNPRHATNLPDDMVVTFVPMPSVRDDSPDLVIDRERPLGQVRSGFTHFGEGDVLFAKITPCMENGKGAVARSLTNAIGCGTTELHVLRPVQGISPDYLYHFLHQKSFRQAAKAAFTGSAGQARVPVSFINQASVPLPPTAEQRRIVAKLEASLSRVRASRQRLEKVPKVLKRFRQAILATAYSGRLTADWRQERPQNESFTERCNWIRVKRTERLVEETEDAKQRGQQTPTLEALVAIPTFDEFALPELPEKWGWINIGYLARVKGGKRLPAGEELSERDTGQPYIRATNLKEGTVLTDDIRFVPEHLKHKIRNYTVRAHDVYITIVGACIGDAGLIPEAMDGANLTENAAKVSGMVGCDPNWMAGWLRSPVAQQLIQNNILSAAQGKLALFRIEQLPLPLPPVPEQHEISRRVEELFKIADHLDERLRNATAQVDNLTQSILARAFRGKLVPTEAEVAEVDGRTFESAEELLSRIHETQSTQISGVRAQRRKASANR
jgi:type I restriction enzyme, S subunit